MTTVLRILGSVPLAALPALGWAHAASGAPHDHDAAWWLGLVAAAALCRTAYHGAQRRLARRRR